MSADLLAALSHMAETMHKLEKLEALREEIEQDLAKQKSLMQSWEEPEPEPEDYLVSFRAEVLMTKDEWVEFEKAVQQGDLHDIDLVNVRISDNNVTFPGHFYEGYFKPRHACDEACKESGGPIGILKFLYSEEE